MTAMTILRGLILIGSLALTLGLRAQSALYWAGGAAIGVQGAAINGTGLETYASALSTAPWGISSSGSGVFITGQNGTVWRMNQDGSDFKSVLSMNAGRGVVEAGGYIYIANAVANSRIFRGVYDGTAITSFTPIVAITGAAFQGLTADENYLYFSDTTNNQIRRTDLDGSNLISLVTGLSAPADLDVTASYIYWADSGSDLIQRANLDGTGVTTLIGSGITDPTGLFVTDTQIFFTQLGLGVFRANLDGSNVTALVTGGNDYRFIDGRVSVIPEPSTYALLAGGLVLGLAAWRTRASASAPCKKTQTAM